MVLPYERPEEVIDYVNSHDRPLALYPFSNNTALVERYIERIMSGGVTVNDALFHVAQHDLPFGGVGPSGNGSLPWFMRASPRVPKMRPVFYQAKRTAMTLMTPPYSKFANKMIDLLVKMKS